MKAKISILAAAISIATLFTACKKEVKTDSTITKNIEVTLAANQSYQLDLGTLSTNKPAVIATQAAHYLISQTDILDAGTTAYNYTPALDYVGTDAVQIKIGGGEMGMHKEHHPKDSIPHKEPLIKLPKLFHAHHSCNKDSVYVYNITFKIAKTTEIAPLAK